jgi:transposase
MAPTTGKATAAVLIADVGDPRDYPSTRAYLKGYGLNLKKKSGGKQKGQLSITKRGPGRARQYLWPAVFRWLQKDAVARASGSAQRSLPSCTRCTSVTDTPCRPAASPRRLPASKRPIKKDYVDRQPLGRAG